MATSVEDKEKNATTSQVRNCLRRVRWTPFGCLGVISSSRWLLLLIIIKPVWTLRTEKLGDFQIHGKFTRGWFSLLFQIEEKTFTHTTSTHANRTEQTMVTQQVRATAVVTTSDQGVWIHIFVTLYECFCMHEIRSNRKSGMTHKYTFASHVIFVRAIGTAQVERIVRTRTTLEPW